MSIGNVNMNFSYREGFGDSSRSAYATLVNDCLRGDATLFDRGDSVEAAWSLVEPILDVWSAAKTAAVPQYASGSWGPKESDGLLERDGLVDGGLGGGGTRADFLELADVGVVPFWRGLQRPRRGDACGSSRRARTSWW